MLACVSDIQLPNSIIMYSFFFFLFFLFFFFFDSNAISIQKGKHYKVLGDLSCDELEFWLLVQLIQK